MSSGFLKFVWKSFPHFPRVFHRKICQIMENINNTPYILPLFLQLAAKRQLIKPRICAPFCFSTIFGPTVVENFGEKGETVIFNLDFTKRNCCMAYFPFLSSVPPPSQAPLYTRCSRKQHRRVLPDMRPALTKAPAPCVITERRCLPLIYIL